MIQILEEGLFRITMSKTDRFILRDEPMIINSKPAGIKWDLTESNNEHIISTSKLRVVLDKNGAIRYTTAGNELLTREPEKNGRVLRPIDIVRVKYEPDALLEEIQGVDGMRTRAKGMPYNDRKGYQTRLSFVFQENEAIFGLGQHEEGILDYRGQHQFLYQHNLKVACPVFMSSRGWGIFYNSCSAMTFHDDLMGSYISSDADEEMDFFFMYGPEFDDMIGYIRKLTGDAVMLPKWAFGYVQSKERYSTQDELLEIAREYRERNIPLDIIVQDWQTWEEGFWGQKSVDKKRYPDLAGCIDELHKLDVKIMFSIWPHMQGNGANQQEFLKKGLLLGNRSTYNAFSEEARKVYWKQVNDELFSKGVDAWWCDCTEPFEADWYGTEPMIPEDRFQLNVSEFKAYLDPAMINAYSIMHSRGIWEGQRGVTDKKRVINLTRSGYPGQQRYGTIVWNGDPSATWEILRRSIPDGLNFCLSGQPYWNFDVGAFFSGSWEHWFSRGEYEDGCNDPEYRELYLRWLQVGIFLPMLRSHGTCTPREVWRFGEKGEYIYDAIVDAINFRMILLPYIYSIMGDTALNKGTPLRMLAFDYRYDPVAIRLKDQFMLGRGLMVCPVLEPGAVSRDVYLPNGSDWFDFYTGEKFNCSQTISVDAPLNKVPLFVPAGTIIPTGPVRQHAFDLPGAETVLLVFPGKDGSFVLYEDEGDGYGYECGEFIKRTITWNDSAQKLKIAACVGTYPGMQETAMFIARLPDGREKEIRLAYDQEAELSF